LAAALKKEPLTILVLGPGTNVATVVKNHPELQERIKSVIAVAARRPGQHFSTGTATRLFRDFNFEMDAEAFAVLLRSPVPLVMTPWEISSKVWLNADDLENFKKANGAGEYLYGPAMNWLATWKKAFGVDGFNPFDTLAVAYVTSRSLLQCDDLGAEIRTQASDTGEGDKPYLLVASAGQRRVTYCHTPDAAFRADLMKRLNAKPAGPS
jgi:pyrimidine-specific ribonucleoside hydrolase